MAKRMLKPWRTPKKSSTNGLKPRANSAARFPSRAANSPTPDFKTLKQPVTPKPGEGGSALNPQPLLTFPNSSFLILTFFCEDVRQVHHAHASGSEQDHVKNVGEPDHGIPGLRDRSEVPRGF